MIKICFQSMLYSVKYPICLFIHLFKSVIVLFYRRCFSNINAIPRGKKMINIFKDQIYRKCLCSIIPVSCICTFAVLLLLFVLCYSQTNNLNCKIDEYHLELWACDKLQARGMSLITKTEIRKLQIIQKRKCLSFVEKRE